MQAMFQSILEDATILVGSYLPNLLGALAVLVVGWLVAHILGAMVRGGMKRMTLDNRLADWLAGTDTEMEIEHLAGRLTYWLVMLFVLVAFLQVLDLTLMTEPLNALLTQITEFLPRVVGAAMLLAVAWLLASLLRRLVGAALGATGLDRRIGADAGVDEDEMPLSRSVAEAVYWLVFLLFLPAVLSTLAIQGLLEPVQGLTDQILGFLPNLVAAALVLAVGWFLARLVQRIVSNLAAATGIDRLGEQLGIDQFLGRQRLSSLIGLILYVLILIPVLIAALNALAIDAVTRPASAMLGQILDAVPRLFAAALLLVLAWVAARLVAGLIARVLAGLGFDRLLDQIGLVREREGDPERDSASEMVGTLIVVAIMLFASVEAASLLGFEALATLISGFIVFAGKILLGLVLFAIGLYLSNVAADTIRASGARQSGLLAEAARVAILVLAGAMALREAGLANDIINLAFGLVLGAIAVAVALAFGLGARDVAGDYVRHWTDTLVEPESGARESDRPGGYERGGGGD